MDILTRKLGRSGIEISAIGLGCWAIGGPFWKNGQPVGWGEVDDSESIRAIQHALELGVTFFDTAAVYGCGHSERVLGRAIAGRRDKVVLATKFGQMFDEETRQVVGYNTHPERIREECEDSLRRLGVEYIDLYQLHVKDIDDQHALVIRDTLEGLVAAGKIRYYGWSTDAPDKARIFAEGPHCTAIQQQLNLFDGDLETLAVCEQFKLASINRGPLAMGLLTGKFDERTVFPASDVRSRRAALQEGRAARLEKLEKARELLTQGGCSLAQGALGWLLARSQQTIPIPGFKNSAQVEENAGALRLGALSTMQMRDIAAALE